ncbi:MAG: metallophosphoesterase [Muribaculaceae bacterium]|nr:metallophosphoesterase [Muribaculaceae bacterium]
MRTILLMIIATLLTCSSVGAKKTSADYKIMVLSDTHVLAPKLASENLAALAEFERSDMRFIGMSSDLLNEAIEQIIMESPNLVLITGDLTNNGELESHQFMVSRLDYLLSKGIKTLVIPGNHDINNPNAKRWTIDGIAETNTVTRSEFANLYSLYGYGTDSNRDPNSLSYSCEPIKGLVVIALDSNRDEENMLTSRGDSVNSYHNAGKVKKETIDWAKEQARQAHKKGKKVIAMIHHHVVPHFDSEATLLPNYIISNAHEVADSLKASDCRLVFSGHLHVNDIATDGNVETGDTITEIATGSLSTYPFPYRIITADKKFKHFDVSTDFITSLPNCSNLKELGLARVKSGVKSMTSMLSNKIWNKLQGNYDKIDKIQAAFGADLQLPSNAEELNVMINNLFGKQIEDVLIAFIEGDESKHDYSYIISDIKGKMNKVLTAMVPADKSFITDFIVEELTKRIKPLLNSIIEDRNNCDSENERVVDDLNTRIDLW